ncbi:hypothetical protein ACLUEY_07120 [Vreelandella aquamarina]
MEPTHNLNNSGSAIKAKNIALILAVTLFVATVPVIANASQEDNIESRIIQYVQGIDITAIQGNTSIIQQNGNNNQADTIQSRSAMYQFGNLAHIYQSGNNNQASIYQSNGSNVGIITQVGNNHNAEIIQEGNKREASIQQFGHHSEISLSQSGSGLRGINVLQKNNSGSARPVTIDTY